MSTRRWNYFESFKPNFIMWKRIHVSQLKMFEYLLLMQLNNNLHLHCSPLLPKSRDIPPVSHKRASILSVSHRFGELFLTSPYLFGCLSDVCGESRMRRQRENLQAKTVYEMFPHSLTLPSPSLHPLPPPPPEFSPFAPPPIYACWSGYPCFSWPGFIYDAWSGALDSLGALSGTHHAWSASFFRTPIQSNPKKGDLQKYLLRWWNVMTFFRKYFCSNSFAGLRGKKCLVKKKIPNTLAPKGRLFL